MAYDIVPNACVVRSSRAPFRASMCNQALSVDPVLGGVAPESRCVATPPKTGREDRASFG